VADVWREWKEGIGGPPLEALEQRWGHRLRPMAHQRVAWSRRKVLLDEILRLRQGGLSAAEAVSQLDGLRDGRSIRNLSDRLTAQRTARPGQEGRGGGKRDGLG